ncbi:MAG: 2Fe-2S iron-sulfur cluster-binding protein [Victivallales bacterium]|jgi:ferredoxin
MPKLTIDGQHVEVAASATIIEAAAKLGIKIPTLCHKEGFEHNTSCMVCVVKVEGLERLVPGCAMPVAEGMVVDTRSDEVREARRMSLELLLSDHVGDCEGPCRAICAAAMNIPLMLRLIQAGEWEKAYTVAKKDLVLPETLGFICPAPCEKGCRRKQHDSPLAIKSLHRLISRRCREKGNIPVCEAAGRSGKKVAIVGAGPAGLSTAFQLAVQGHACVLYDNHDLPGGMLRHAIPEDILPHQVLDSEIKLILSMGIAFIPSYTLKDRETLNRLCGEYDAVVLALGTGADIGELGLTTTHEGVSADHITGATSMQGVFAAGGIIRPIHKMAVRAIGSGRHTAKSVDYYLRYGKNLTEPHQINVKMGLLKKEEMEIFLRDSNRGECAIKTEGRDVFSDEECKLESCRCLHCDCRASANCSLRSISSEYLAHTSAFKHSRRMFEQDASHPDIIYEQGKCIACGLCIQAAEKAGERSGNTFIGRGFDVRIVPPSGKTMSEALKISAMECVQICPTGALSLKGKGID